MGKRAGTATSTGRAERPTGKPKLEPSQELKAKVDGVGQQKPGRTISSADLGLKTSRLPGKPAKPVRPKKKNIYLSKINIPTDRFKLNRAGLDRQKLLTALDSPQARLTGRARFSRAIRVYRKSDGSYVASRSDTHRIAALKLLGYVGRLPVIVI